MSDSQQQKGKIKVEIVAARNLVARDMNGFSDPYCIVSFGQNQSRTEIRYKTLDPVWETTVYFDVASGDELAELNLELWDWDRMSSDDFLGITKLPLSQLIESNNEEKAIDRWLALGPRKKKKDVVTGEVHIRVFYMPAAEEVTKDDFEMLATIGKGGFGKVLQVKKKDSGRIYAMKIIQKERVISKDKVQHVLTEKSVLQTFHHPFLTGLKYSFQSENKLYLVMDFVNGGELFFHLRKEKRFPENKVKFYAAEILLAIEHLHRNGIIYRDLKPENVLLDSKGHVVLTDFGLCKAGLGYGDKTSTFCGTPEYLAPEVLLGKPYTKAVDWWSFGVLTYEMLRGVPPFYDTNTQQMYDKVLSSGVIGFPKKSSQEFRDFICHLLDRDPKTRLGSGPEESEDIKNHPFFKGIDWEGLLLRDITPPTTMELASDVSLEHVDPEFLNEKPHDSDDEEGVLDENDQALFGDFTYVSNDATLTERVRRMSLAVSKS